MGKHRMRTRRRRAQAVAAVRTAVAMWHTGYIEAWSDYFYSVVKS